MLEEKLKCFVIMPISDQDSYDRGHFTRVYEYLIKPACESAGFIPERADDDVKTNYIVLDIINKILAADMVLCDLSGKNPNVLYELGIRQAFNKKTLLIKDIKTSRIFDIQGLRTIDYDESLRVDSVKKDKLSISKSLKDTFEANEDEVNSLIQLLAIKPAVINDSVELSNESSLLLKAINDVQDRLSIIEKNNTNSSKFKEHIINDIEFNLGWKLYFENEEDKFDIIGTIVEILNDKIIIETGKGEFKVVTPSFPNFKELKTIPF